MLRRILDTWLGRMLVVGGAFGAVAYYAMAKLAGLAGSI